MAPGRRQPSVHRHFGLRVLGLLLAKQDTELVVPLDNLRTVPTSPSRTPNQPPPLQAIARNHRAHYVASTSSFLTQPHCSGVRHGSPHGPFLVRHHLGMQVFTGAG